MALNRQNVKEVFPCFGHFAQFHCMNLGYLQHKRGANGVLGVEHCPLEKLCRQEALKYHEHMDVVESGQIDRPREIIRRLKK